MGEPEHKRIFISYAHRDGVRLATELQRELGREHDVWLDRRRIEGGASWTTEIEGAIDRCDVLLAVLTRGSFESDICRAEQLRALRKSKVVIPLVVERDVDRPLYLETRNYRDFSKQPVSAEQLQQLRKDIGAGRDGATLAERFRFTYVTAPPLPRNYVERREAIELLRSAVILDEPGPSVALTALRGMGGIGKTILAQALCHDEAIQQAFPDGIAWTTVGNEAAHTLTARMQEVRRALGDAPGDGESEVECVNRYRTLVLQKHALIVVDDIWRVADIEPFLAESSRSRLLFTTRDGDIVASTGAVEHLADLMGSDEARALLARWAGCPHERLPAEADELVQECGRLPLAVSMVGAMLRGKPPAYWGHVLGLLRRADLARIRTELPFYRHPDLLRTIQVSVDALEASDRRRYLAMAVLLEDMAAAPAVQQTLWGVGADEALETAERFVTLSLAQRDSEAIRLHDLQLDYVRAQYPDHAALELIHGAVRLSSHVIAREPRQFASQVLGRLLPHSDVLGIQLFAEEIAKAAPRPWIRLLHPALHPPGTGLVRTLEGHCRAVIGVAVTADGRRAVSASEDETLKVWDLESGRELRTLEGHSDAVIGVAMTTDGKRAVSASLDMTLKVWDLESGRELRTLEGHSNWVNSVAVAADGKRAVSASEDKTLKVWDLESGRELLTLASHSMGVRGVAVTEDGRRAVSASKDWTLKVWDLESGRELRTLEGHSDWFLSVAVTADGKRAVSASRDKTLKVWDLESGRELRTLEGHSGRVDSVAVGVDGKRAVSASGDKTLKVWDLESGHELRTLAGHSMAVTGVAVTRDARRAVSASEDETLKVWDLESGRELRTLEGHSDGVNGVVVAPDGKRAVSASWDETLKVWDLESGRELRCLEGHSGWVFGVAMTADGKRAVSASEDQTLMVWNLNSGRELCTLEGHSDSVNGVAVSGDGRRAVSASDDKTLRLWDLVSCRERRTLKGHSGPVNGVAVTADGKRAVSASKDKTLKVWDLDNGSELHTLEGHSDSVKCVAVTADGTRAASASDDKTLKLWGLESGVALVTFYLDSRPWCCAFARNDLIVAGDSEGRIYFLQLVE